MYCLWFRAFETPFFFEGVGLRVFCNFLIHEIGDLKLSVSLFTVKKVDAVM